MSEKKELKEEDIKKVSGGAGSPPTAYCYDCKKTVTVTRRGDSAKYFCTKCNGNNIGEITFCK